MGAMRKLRKALARKGELALGGEDLLGFYTMKAKEAETAAIAQVESPSAPSVLSIINELDTPAFNDEQRALVEHGRLMGMFEAYEGLRCDLGRALSRKGSTKH